MKNSVDNEKRQYSFKLLREESIDKDLFEDKTHERIADSLLKLITTEKKGISIGLEGPWGSGKSTVVSILRRKLKEKDPLIPLIQFDAWAHEGDPLRRIFLESLIDEIKSFVEPNVKNELDDLKEKVAQRRKTSKIKTTRTTTSLGKLLSVTLFLVPLGVAFLSGVNYSDLSFSGKPYWLFLFGIIFSAAPLFVALGNLVRIFGIKRLREKGIFNSKNWAFLEEEADTEITQEVSEEDERSSIEFERYFDQIMKIFFNNSEVKKLILVIDNLDRIDVNDALKIWSTLQTFLSQRTQTWFKKEWFDKIWIIVPYDSEGLSRLWNRTTDEIDQNLSKPFFDKCFQLRLEVPKPIFSGWEMFAKCMMDEAFENWPQRSKDELVRVLRLTRRDLTDIPTPREIKNYINHVGFLASQWGNIMSISSIAYFVCWRELANKSIEKIKSRLVKNELMEPSHKALLSNSCVRDIAGLVFGVGPEKGVQLLLEPKIASALKNGDGESLLSLCEDHGEGFWHIFNYYVEHNDMDFSLALTSAKAVFDSLWENNREKLNEFVSKISQIDMETASREIEWNEQEIEKYKCLIEICHKEKAFINNIYHHLIECVKSSIRKNKDEIDWQEIIKSLSTVTNTMAKASISVSKETIKELSLSNLIPLAKASNALRSETYKWILPPESIVEEIRNAIVPGQPLQAGLAEAVQYSIEAGIKSGWDTVLSHCQQYINWNQGNYSNQSDDIFKITNIITFKLCDLEEINQIASSIVTSGRYHNLLWHRRTQNLIYGALLCGYVFKNELQSKSVSGVGNSTVGFNEIKNFWANSNKNNAEQILDEMKKYQLWSFLWGLSTDDKNKLVRDIISLALDDEDAVDLFRVKSSLSKLKNFSNLFENTDDIDEKILKLIEKFIEYADLANEIVAIDNEDLIEYDYELYLVIKKTENHQVITKIAEELRKLNKEAWFETLKENTYLTSLALEVKKKREEFFLENSFTDALIEFINNQSGYSEWEKEHWHELFSLMGASFQKYYRDQITEYLCNNLNTILPDTFNLNKEYFHYQELVYKTKVIQHAIDFLVKKEDIERLHIINEILSKCKFKFDKYFLDVVKTPIQDLYVKQESKENKSVIKSLAEKLSIDLPELSEEDILGGE